MMPNSWRYMVVFLREYHGVGIFNPDPLALPYFHLSKGLGGYYLSSRGGFRVSGVPSNNKGVEEPLLLY